MRGYQMLAIVANSMGMLIEMMVGTIVLSGGRPPSYLLLLAFPYQVCSRVLVKTRRAYRFLHEASHAG
jgi:hypothetical protein